MPVCPGCKSNGELPINESDSFWEDLLDLIEAKYVVPIVGQDLLTIRRDDGDVLLYPWLASRLAEALQVSAEDLPQGGELNAVACRYLERSPSSQAIYLKLHRVMPGDDELPIPEPLRQLAAMPFQLFVTTTFDSLLQRALDEARFGGRPKTEVLAFSPSRKADLPCGLESLERPTVFHIFGQLAVTPTYAVTEADTLEFVHSLGADPPEYLLDEFKTKSLLVLGSSFRGWLARFFLRTAKRQPLKASETTDYFAETPARGDSGLAVFLRTFSSGSKIFQGGGAVEFVDELRRRWLERYPVEGTAAASPAPRSATQEMEPGSVFLSYASEDAAAVAVLKEALEAAGIDVYFDKQQLRAGDDFEARLMRAIRSCSLFVPVISEHTMTGLRRFFRREWAVALDESLAAVGRFIVPVVIDETPPQSEAIPEGFRKLHWEPTPGGKPTPDFVEQVKQDFRSYQKYLARAS